MSARVRTLLILDWNDKYLGENLKQPHMHTSEVCVECAGLKARKTQKKQQQRSIHWQKGQTKFDCLSLSIVEHEMTFIVI